MTVYEAIKKFFKQIVGSINHKIDLMNQKEAERIQALEEKNRKQTELNFSTYLRKRWALVLNSLPEFIRISSSDIYYNCLSNKFWGSYWEICIPLQSKISNIKCKTLEDSMQKILLNQSHECYQDFESRLNCDSNEYQYQMYLVKNNLERNIDDSVFLLNYMRFYEDNYFKLMDISIININSTDDMLYIKYNIDISSCISYS